VAIAVERRSPSPRRFASLTPVERFTKFAARFPKESAAFLDMMEVIWDTQGKLDRRADRLDRRGRRIAQASDRS
jgi:hypothetical protein